MAPPFKTDPVRVAATSAKYDELRGSKRAPTLKMMARRYGVCLYALWNFRRKERVYNPLPKWINDP